MKENETLKINPLPSKTWYWLHLNDTTVKWNGDVQPCTHCPECNAELDKIERPPKTTFFTWLIAILAALIVGIVVYGIFEPNF